MVKGVFKEWVIVGKLTMVFSKKALQGEHTGSIVYGKSAN
jgi:hypothetical protein